MAKHLEMRDGCDVPRLAPGWVAAGGLVLVVAMFLIARGLDDTALIRLTGTTGEPVVIELAVGCDAPNCGGH